MSVSLGWDRREFGEVGKGNDFGSIIIGGKGRVNVPCEGALVVPPLGGPHTAISA